jgi:hypothetical protein
MRNGYTGQVVGGTSDFPPSNAWQSFSLTGFVIPTATQVGVQVSYSPSGTAGGFDYFDVTGVQLEKGSVATPFEVRPFATELALCQRYYHRIGIATGQAPIVCPMTIIAATTAEGVYKLPVTMRSNVITVGTSGTFTLDWFTVNANSVGAIAVIAGQTSTDVAALVATSVGNGTVGSVTVGQTRFLITSGYTDFSTEL